MAEFTIRVELHQTETDRPDYAPVHKKLHDQGFTHVITDGKGRQYAMPFAEYSYAAEMTEEAVLNYVKNTLSETTKVRFCILVTKSAGRASYGLQQVDSHTRLG